MFAASSDGQVMPMRRGQRPWERPARPSASGGSLTLWDPMVARASLASSEPPARQALPGPSKRTGVRSIIEGTIIAR